MIDSADWFDAIMDRASVIQDPSDIALLTPETYDLCRGGDYGEDSRMEPSGIYGDYITTEAFQALADRFILAWELIKMLEPNYPEFPDGSEAKT